MDDYIMTLLRTIHQAAACLEHEQKQLTNTVNETTHPPHKKNLKTVATCLEEIRLELLKGTAPPKLPTHLLPPPWMR